MAEAAAKARSLWGMVSDNSIHPERVYAKASDQNGHHEFLPQTKVAPETLHRMVKLMNDPAWPEYDSVSAVMRDALIHLFDLRKDQVTDPVQREGIEDYLKVIAREERIRAIEFVVARYAALQDRLQNAMGDLYRQEAWNFMVMILNEEEPEAETLPEPFRTRALTQVREWRVKLPKEYR